MDRRETLEEGLIGLMNSLGISKVRMIFTLALIRAHNLHEEMVRWIASYKGKEDTMTAQAFISKVGRLSEMQNNATVRLGGYFAHPERYDQNTKTKQDEATDE